MAGPSDDYIRFDQFEDVVASVELVASVAPVLDDNPSQWKWMVVGAQSALQGAMACALFDDAEILAPANPKNKQAARLAAKLDLPQQLIENRLEKFGVLLKRCIAGNRFCEPLVLTPQQRKDINRLHREFRNTFIHFAPLGWSIEKATLTRIIGTALDAVEELLTREQVVNRFEACDQEARLTKALLTARGALRG